MTLAALEGSATLTELAQRFDVYANQIAEWRRQLVAQAAEVFSDGVPREAPIDVKALHARSASRRWSWIFWPTRSGAGPVRAA